jgi:ribosome-binding ATPase YchF (GTP1/OBG family)
MPGLAIRKGIEAVKAAGKIHSDIERALSGLK